MRPFSVLTSCSGLAEVRNGGGVHKKRSAKRQPRSRNPAPYCRSPLRLPPPAITLTHNGLLNRTPSSILDLGCGPGFYSRRLATRGHRCHGIDFGPASIEYARQNNSHESRCRFVSGDIRQVAFGGPYDLAMILYGELNVFSPAEALAILRKVQRSLASQGRLIVEVQAPEAIERLGRSKPSEQQSESGVFSDCPHWP